MLHNCKGTQYPSLKQRQQITFLYKTVLEYMSLLTVDAIFITWAKLAENRKNVTPNT